MEYAGDLDGVFVYDPLEALFGEGSDTDDEFGLGCLNQRTKMGIADAAKLFSLGGG